MLLDSGFWIHTSRMNKHGFTLIEILLVIAILPTISGLTIVSFQRFQIRSDLNLASEQINQGIARARLLAQNGKDDGAWGFYASNGTVFEGLSYPTRTIASEEYYPMPSTIQISGLTEVVFSKGEGRPSATGTIVLTDLTGEQRQVNILSLIHI